MKKLTKSQLQTISKRLDGYFNNASKEDIESWLLRYKDAYEKCVSIAKLYNTDTFTVASVVSALSPRNKWEQNMRDTVTVFDAVYSWKSATDVKVSTFHKNKFKAFAIAKREVEITPNSKKTYAFVNNIAHLSQVHITIDVRHARACFWKDALVNGLAYDQIAKLTLRKAQKLGLKWYEYQAIVWNSVKSSWN